MESCRRDPVALPRPPRARGGEQDARGDGRRDGGGGAGGSRARRRGVARGDAHSSRAPRARGAAPRFIKMRSAAKAAAANRGRRGWRLRFARPRPPRRVEPPQEEAAKAEVRSTACASRAASRIQAALLGAPRATAGGRAAARRRERRPPRAAAAQAAGLRVRRARDAAATRIRSARRARAAARRRRGETPAGWPTRFATRSPRRRR